MTEKYMNISSLDPIYWGKSGWIFLNSIALTFKPENKENYKKFIELLPYILPCKTCGENLMKNISTLDEALLTKENFLNWLINIRNEIYIENGDINKKKTLEQTLNEIFNNGNINNTYIYILLLILGLLIIIYMINFTVNVINF